SSRPSEARAGTHNHKIELLKRVGATARFNTRNCGYGSLLSQGRQRGYCPLIAQVTLTVIDSCSSPGATGAAELTAIGAAILLRKPGGGAAPSSVMLIGSPSVTPAAFA